MKVHFGIDIPFPSQNSIVTIGTFDGLHHGHRKILAQLKQIKLQTPKAETVVMSFYPHPRTVVGGFGDLKILSTLDEKIALISAENIDHLLLLPFDRNLSEMSPNDFTQKILCDYLHTKHLIIGYDHKFGKNRAGNYAFLKENESKFGFKVQEITKQEIDDVAVSSTKIRNALLIGDVKMANEYLESTYQLTGMVVKGNQIGRTLGFPTANLQLTDAQKLIPANGIYAVTVFIKNQFYKAVLSIGVRPTIGDNLEKTVEVNIFDFNEDIYGEKITLNFYQYLRPEQKFDSLEDLVKQMNLDKKQALEFLNSRF